MSWSYALDDIQTSDIIKEIISIRNEYAHKVHIKVANNLLVRFCVRMYQIFLNLGASFISLFFKAVFKDITLAAIHKLTTVRRGGAVELCQDVVLSSEVRDFIFVEF